MKVKCPHCDGEFDEDDAVVVDWPPTVDNSLVERLAEAIWEDSGMAPPWGTTSEAYRDEVRRLARLSLAAVQRHVSRRPVDTSVVDRVAKALWEKLRALELVGDEPWESLAEHWREPWREVAVAAIGAWLQ